MEEVGYEEGFSVEIYCTYLINNRDSSDFQTHSETLRYSLYTGRVGGAVVVAQQLMLWVTDKEVGDAAVGLLIKALTLFASGGAVTLDSKFLIKETSKSISLCCNAYGTNNGFFKKGCRCFVHTDYEHGSHEP